MTETTSPRGLSRRELLTRGTALGTAYVVGAGFLAHATDAWAMETKELTPAQMATLIQMARDIYPHDKISDKFYAIAVKGHDEEAAKDPAYKTMMTEGLGTLDNLAQGAGAPSYLGMGWEADRVALLRQIADSHFFQTIRGGLIVGLYNQKAVWPIFGYEGESFSKGGYIERGFNDISWL